MSAEIFTGKKKSADRVRSAGFVLWQQFCKYCSCTALHGYQYITEPGRPLIERIIWLLCHCCAITVASVMIYATWTRYLESPTATAVETTNFPVWKVPFPAVTICDPNQVTLSNAKKVAQRMSEGNKAAEEELLGAFPYLREILKHNYAPYGNVSFLHLAMKKYGSSMVEFMRELAPSCSDMLVHCQWKGVEVPCNQLFSRSMTDNGMCCSFNYAPPCLGKNCTSNRAHPTSLIPEFTTSVGNKYGLRVTLKYSLHERFVPTISTDAMRVMLHNWYTYPNQWSAADQLIPRGTYKFMRVTTEATVSSDPVKKLPLAKSGCIYEEEEKTNSGHADDSSAPVSKYSRDNCLVDCRRINVINVCDCQPYYYPTTDDVRFCDFQDLPCIFKYKGFLSRLKPSKKDLTNDGQKIWNGQDGMECDCSPQCNEVNYRMESTSGNLQTSVFNPHHPANHSVFYAFFGKMTGTRYRRDLLLSSDTMLSNAGGLFGLFMGFSLLSVVEFIYFFTVRLYFESRDKKKRKESLKKWSAKVRPNSRKINLRMRLPVKDDFGRYRFEGQRRSHFVY